jgi:succinyl-CoA synthetase beta subunit
MNIHEYQGKEILASYGVRIQRGIVANNAVEAVAAAKQLTNRNKLVCSKAQVHAGGRKRWRSKLAKTYNK